MRLTPLLLVTLAAPLAAQVTPAVPGVTCDSSAPDGSCVAWRASPQAIRYYAKALAGKRIRLTGVIIARCSDQTLYFSAEGARHGWRESALQLFNALPAELNAIDSMSVIEVEGIFHGPYSRGFRGYAGALEEVVVIGRHGTVKEDSAGVQPSGPSPISAQAP